jgi:predicted nucleic acid-binding protein
MTSLKQYYKASVIVDNNVLIDFCELDRLGLLFDVFSKVGIPKLIHDKEIEENVIDILGKYHYELYNMETETAYDAYAVLTTNKRFRRLSECDKLAVSIAKQFDYYCTSNDGLVREACKELNVKYIGTLGVIGCAFAVNLIEKEEFLKIIGLLLSDSTSCHLKLEIVNSFLEKFDIVSKKE